MSFYDRMFTSMYALTGKTSLDGQPSLSSTQIMLSGFESANVFTCLLFWLHQKGHLGLPKATYLIVMFALLLGNVIYVWARGSWVLSQEHHAKPHLALVYGAVSFVALVGVMAVMIFRMP